MEIKHRNKLHFFIFPFEFHKERGQICIWKSSKHEFYMLNLCHVDTPLFLKYSFIAALQSRVRLLFPN